LIKHLFFNFDFHLFVHLFHHFLGQDYLSLEMIVLFHSGFVQICKFLHFRVILCNLNFVFIKWDFTKFGLDNLVVVSDYFIILIQFFIVVDYLLFKLNDLRYNDGMQVLEVLVLCKPLEVIPELFDFISFDFTLDFFIGFAEIGVHSVKLGLHIRLYFPH